MINFTCSQVTLTSTNGHPSSCRLQPKDFKVAWAKAGSARQAKRRPQRKPKRSRLLEESPYEFGLGFGESKRSWNGTGSDITMSLEPKLGFWFPSVWVGAAIGAMTMTSMLRASKIKVVLVGGLCIQVHLKIQSPKENTWHYFPFIFAWNILEWFSEVLRSCSIWRFQSYLLLCLHHAGPKWQKQSGSTSTTGLRHSRVVWVSSNVVPICFEIMSL